MWGRTDRSHRTVARPSDGPPLGHLAAVDLDREAILGSVELGRGPHTLVVDPVDSRVYVTNEADDTVTVVQGIQPPPDTPMPACR